MKPDCFYIKTVAVCGGFLFGKTPVASYSESVFYGLFYALFSYAGKARKTHMYTLLESA